MLAEAKKTAFLPIKHLRWRVVGRVVGHIRSWLCVGSENNHKGIQILHWSYGWTYGICGRVLVGQLEKNEIGHVLVAKSANQYQDQLSLCGDGLLKCFALSENRSYLMCRFKL